MIKDRAGAVRCGRSRGVRRPRFTRPGGVQTRRGARTVVVMTGTRMRDVGDRDFIALLDRAASESAYRLGGAHRALRGGRPSVRRRWELVIVAGVAGFVGVMAVLTARRWM